LVTIAFFSQSNDSATGTLLTLTSRCNNPRDIEVVPGGDGFLL
jgi:hypothetical protein